VGFTFVQGAWYSNLTKIPLIYSVSNFNLDGLGALFGGLSSTKPSVVTGLRGILVCYLRHTLADPGGYWGDHLP